MMSAARAAAVSPGAGASTRVAVLLIFPAPAVSVSSPAARPEFTTTPPFVPAAALCMWPMLILVSAGQPVTSVSNNAVAPVMTPAASLVVVRVNVPLPAHVASAPAIGGTSFDVLRSAVKMYLSCGVGAGVGVAATVGWVVGDAVGATAAGPHALKMSAPVVSPARRRRIDTSSCTAVIRRGITSG